MLKAISKVPLLVVSVLLVTASGFSIPHLARVGVGSTRHFHADCTVWSDFDTREGPRHSGHSRLSSKRSATTVPSFSVHVDEDDQDESDEYVEPSASLQTKVSQRASVASMVTPDASPRTSDKVKVQYAALEPGTVVQIQVGDVSRARKAWKKRRRTDSPLLVPCSVLNVDLASTVRWNLIYLLEKFGQKPLPSMSKTATTASPSASSGAGIRISLSELSRRSRTHLKASLLDHATTLGYANVASLVKGLFRKPVQDAYGVKLVLHPDDSESDEEDNVVDANGMPSSSPLWLETPLSRVRAQRRASEAAILQFFSESSPSLQPSDTLQHTGVVRNKRPPLAPTDASQSSNSSKSSSLNLYQLKPLSAALRVNQEDVDLGVIANGSLHAAVVFDYDPLGDAGVAPLLTLSLNPQRNQVRDRLKVKTSSYPTTMTPDAVRYNFSDLSMGQALTGKVVKLVQGGAIMDCGVGRSSTGVNTPVYALLRFKDAIVNPNDNTAAGTVSGMGAPLFDTSDGDDEDWGDVFSLDDLDSLDDEDDDEYDDEDEDDGVEDNDQETVSNASNDEDDDTEEEVLAEFSLDKDDEFAEGEDITHLFELYDDGRLAYTDPETGEVTVISDIDLSSEIMEDEDDADLDEDEDDNDEDDDILYEDGDMEDDDMDDDDMDDEDMDEEDMDDDQPTLLGRFATSAGMGMGALLPPSSDSGTYKTRTLRPGDRIDVFVKSVSKQSSQLVVTMDSSIQGKTAKDIKKEGDVSKKVSRLAKQLGGYARIRELTGMQCNGVIKAVSNAGDWYYVQPQLDDDSVVPVGVATLADPRDELVLVEGDAVRIQINGIDEDRGQLAMHILTKLPSR